MNHYILALLTLATVVLFPYLPVVAGGTGGIDYEQRV